MDRMPAAALEAVVVEVINQRFGDREWLASALRDIGVCPEMIAGALDRAGDLVGEDAREASKAENWESAAGYLHRLDLMGSALRIQMNLAPLLDQTEITEMLTKPFEVPIALQRNGRNRPIVLRAATCMPHRDPDLIAIVADARRWTDELVKGKVATVAEITEREQLRPGNVSRALPLAWLALDIAAAILEGHQPADLTAKKLRELPDLPLDWSEQCRVLGFPAVCIAALPPKGITPNSPAETSGEMALKWPYAETRLPFRLGSTPRKPR